MGRFTAHSIEDRIDLRQAGSETRGTRIDNDFDSQCAEHLLVSGASNRNYSHSGIESHFDGIGTHVSGSACDQDRISAFRLGIFEEHLPGGDCDNRCRSCLKVIQARWLRRDHSRERDGEFGLCAAKLWIRYAVDRFAYCELAHIGTNRLNEAREVGTKRQWGLLAYLALAFTNDCVPGSDACGGNAHQHLTFVGHRLRNLFNKDDLRRSVTVDAHRFHINHTSLTEIHCPLVQQ